MEVIEAVDRFTVQKPVKRYEAGNIREENDAVIKETLLTLKVNGEMHSTHYCSPDRLEDLAAGYLESEGLIQNKEDIADIDIVTAEDLNSATASIVINRDIGISAEDSGSKPGRRLLGIGTDAKKNEPELRIKASFILQAMELFQSKAAVFGKTGGTHSAAMYNAQGLLDFVEDIARHNALDKIFGRSLRQGIIRSDKIILSSGRLSAVMVGKVIRRAVPVMVSKSAPTDAGIRLAEENGLTLVGFTRGSRMNIYADPGRLRFD